MNFFSAIPAQLLETTINNALLQGLSNPSRNRPIDPTPYQLQQMRHYHNSCGVDSYVPPAQLTNFTRPTNPVLQTKLCPPAARIHSNNLWY